MGTFTDRTGEQIDLDKDILHEGNLIYSPSNCCFVPHSINMLLVKSDETKGLYPTGITFYKGKYVATISINNKSKHIGRFSTLNEALLSYEAEKISYTRSKLLEYKEYLPKHLFNKLYKILILSER